MATSPSFNEPRLESHLANDDDVSLSGYQTLSASDEVCSVPTERDEVNEVRKMAKKDTRSVHLWRLAATVALLLTAVSVTAITYHFLKNQETSNFETAFEQFSTSIAGAAIGQQIDVRNGLYQFSTFISAWGNSDQNNESLPFVTLPDFEQIGENIRNQAGLEVLGFQPLIFHDQRDAWVEYATANYEKWVKEGHMYKYGNLSRLKEGTYHPFISQFADNGTSLVPRSEEDLYAPFWLFSPPPASHYLINGDSLAIPRVKSAVMILLELQNETVFSPVQKSLTIPTAFTEEEHAAYHSKLADSTADNPHALTIHPVYRKTGDPNSGAVGVAWAVMAWDAALLNLLPEGVEGIHAVLRSTCNQTFTYNVVGSNAFFLGGGDKHEHKFDKYKAHVKLSLHTHPNFESVPGNCIYSMEVYPSQRFQDSFDDNTPETFSAIVASTFVLVAVAFFIYDLMQTRRNSNLIMKAAQSNAIVTSLIPDIMRDRMFQQAEQQQGAKQKKGDLKSFLNDGKKGAVHGVIGIQTKPMADLFLSTTVLVADICGFTAWSTVREPTQVFLLLESLFAKFDDIARRRRVMKVETVGDSYVAVCGLPEARKDHAVAMVRYARDILINMYRTTKELEVTLGPDTAELGLRIGIHSGPVTAGVLRGERARFQLFGDTMNVVYKIEASGSKGRIHCSKETAELLIDAGKESWVEKRQDVVHARGIGAITTYYVKADTGESVASGSKNEFLEPTASYGRNLPGLDEKTHRLINWNVEMMLRLLKQIVAHRGSTTKLNDGCMSQLPCDHIGEIPLQEVREIIHLPDYNKRKSMKAVDPDTVTITDEVVTQLHDLVGSIAALYRDNPFHSFEHASHVVMSVIKLLSRIVASDGGDEGASKRSLHDNTYGITSDPLIQFSCAFSALIHDADHQGVSNAQLVKEGVPLADKYKKRSVAEQNSLDLAWSILMRPHYKLLRACLFETEADLARFRQLVVNSVMATDIVDTDLKTLRNGRWEKAFKTSNSSDTGQKESHRDSVNRKATIVIEHIIQASDVSHTMQHWHVYLKWNQNLFEELYVAYLNGRTDKDPAEFWYKGEFGFFDYYIIPLTEKLKDCGVFGVSSGELLHHAKKNRAEWETHGEQAVAKMIEDSRRKYGIKEMEH